MLAIEAEEPVAPIRYWRWAQEVEAPVEGLWYPAFEIGDNVEAGFQLGRILDPLDNEVARIESPVSGSVFYGERSLALAAGDVVAAIAIRED